MSEKKFKRKTFNDIEKIAGKVLEKYNVLQYPAKHMKEIMDKENIIYSESENFKDDINGVFFIKKEVKGITVSREISPERKNFVIAHELGHHFLEHLESDERIECAVSERVDYSKLSLKEDERKEQEANIFASYFLLPKKLIVPYIKMSLRLIKSDKSGVFLLNEKSSKNRNWNSFSSLITHRFKTSKTINKWRLYNLGYVKLPEN